MVDVSTFFFLMIRRPPRSTRTDTLFPYTALFRSATSIIAPQLGETYALPARASARRLKTGDPELQGAVGRDWQNDYADFSIRLKKELQGIESASARREALARMRSEEHTSELQSLMRISYAVFCLKKKKLKNKHDR